MITSLSNRIANYLNNKTSLSHVSYSTLAYGTDILLYTIFSTLGLLFIGLIFNSLKSSIIIISVFYINQTIGGGYHANTHKKCFIVMACFLSIALLFSKLPIPIHLLLFLGFISTIVLFSLPVVLHKNKEYLSDNIDKFIITSRLVTFIEVLLVLYLFYINALPTSYIYAIVLSSISRLVAKIKGKH